MGRTKLKWAVAVAALAIAATPAVAQTVGGGPDAQINVQRQVNLSPGEQVAQTEMFMLRMSSGRGAVRRQLETARAQRDVVKTLCLNDKLNQIDVAIRSATERKQALEAAAKRNDVDLSTHEFNILSVLRGRVDQLVVEANTCVGQEETFAGESAVKQTVASNLPPSTNETDFPPSDPTTEVPQCTSCIR